MGSGAGAVSSLGTFVAPIFDYQVKAVEQFSKNGTVSSALDPFDVTKTKASKDAAKNAANAASAQEAAIAAQQKDYQAQLAKQQEADAVEQGNADASAGQRTAKKRQAALAAGASGRADTILTSPLGIIGGPQGQSKTLLGS